MPPPAVPGAQPPSTGASPSHTHRRRAAACLPPFLVCCCRTCGPGWTASLSAARTGRGCTATWCRCACLPRDAARRPDRRGPAAAAGDGGFTAAEVGFVCLVWLPACAGPGAARPLPDPAAQVCGAQVRRRAPALLASVASCCTPARAAGPTAPERWPSTRALIGLSPEYPVVLCCVQPREAGAARRAAPHRVVPAGRGGRRAPGHRGCVGWVLLVVGDVVGREGGAAGRQGRCKLVLPAAACASGPSLPLVPLPAWRPLQARRRRRGTATTCTAPRASSTRPCPCRRGRAHGLL